MQNINSFSVGVVLFAACVGYAVYTGNDALLKRALRRSVYGDYQADRMYAEEMKQKSIEAFRNNPHRAEFLRNNPGFLDANPDFR